MKKYILNIEGMGCNKCEAKVFNTLSTFDVKHLKVSFKKGKAIFKSEQDYTLDDFKKAIEPLNFNVVSLEVK